MPPPPPLRYKNLATALRRLVSRMVRLLHITFYTASQPLVLCGRYAFLLDRFMLACELVQVRGRTEQKIWRRKHLRAPPKLWAFSHAKFMKGEKKIQQTDLIKYFMTDWLDIICPEQGVRVLPLLTQFSLCVRTPEHKVTKHHWNFFSWINSMKTNQ